MDSHDDYGDGENGSDCGYGGKHDGERFLGPLLPAFTGGEGVASWVSTFLNLPAFERVEGEVGSDAQGGADTVELVTERGEEQLLC